MRKYLTIFIALFLFAGSVSALTISSSQQNILPFQTDKYYLGTTTPSLLEWLGILTKSITIGDLAGGGTKCVQTDNNGTLSKATGACGTGGGGSSFDWPFTKQADNSQGTTTVMSFLGGFYSSASSTLQNFTGKNGTTTNFVASSTLLIGTTTSRGILGLTPLLEVNNTGAIGDSAPMVLINSTDSAGGNADIRINSPDADIEFVESDQTSPAGKWELEAQSKAFTINSRNLGNTSFERNITIAPYSTGGQFGIGTQFDTLTDDCQLCIVATSTLTDAINVSTLTTATGDILRLTRAGALRLPVAGASIYLGDFGSGNNVRIGEDGAADTDRLGLFGAQGVNIYGNSAGLTVMNASSTFQNFTGRNSTTTNATTTTLASGTICLTADTCRTTWPSGSGGTFAYPFIVGTNGTTTFTNFYGGLGASASSTIGGGTVATGLVINGGATSTSDFLHLGSTTLQNYTGTNGTTTNLNISFSQGGKLTIDNSVVSTTTTVCLAGCQYTTIQGALNSGAKYIYVKNGTYAEQITIQNTKTILKAESLSTIIQCNGNTQSPCISSNAKDEFTLDGFTINEANAAEKGTAIDISNSAIVRILNNRTNNFATSTVISDTANNSFYDLIQANTFFNPKTCIEFSGTQANNNAVRDNRCRPYALDGGYGIYLHDARGISISGDFEGTTTSLGDIGIYVDGTSREISIQNPWVEAWGTGLKIESGANRVTINNASITSSAVDIADSGTNTVYINTSKTGTTINNIASSTATNFIAANATSTNLNVSSNFSLGTDYLTDITGTGLSITGGALGLTNNTISGVALGSNLNSFSVSSDFTGTSYNGSASVSDWVIKMSQPHNWTGLQTFANASSTLFSSTIASTSQLMLSGKKDAILTVDANGWVVASSTIGNNQLQNSTISGVALGSNLFALTAGNTLTSGGTYTGATARTFDIDLTHANGWTGLQTFSNASSTLFSSTIASTSQLYLSGFGDGCLNVTGGKVGTTGVACGSGGGGTFAYPFVTQADAFQATSSGIVLSGGLVSASTTLTGATVATGGFLHLGSTTLQNFTGVNSTTTNASTTEFYSTKGFFDNSTSTLAQVTKGLLVGSTSQSTARLQIVNQDFSAVNGGLRVISNSSSGADYEGRFDSPNPDLEFVETDQAAPAGKYEIAGQGDVFQVNGRSAADDTFENFIEFLRPSATPTYLMSIVASSTSATQDSLRLRNSLNSAGAAPGISWYTDTNAFKTARISSSQGSSGQNSSLFFQVANAAKSLVNALTIDVNQVTNMKVASTTVLGAGNAFFGLTATSSFNGVGDLFVTGSTTLQNFTGTNATTSQATTTNFAITASAVASKIPFIGADGDVGATTIGTGIALSSAGSLSATLGTNITPSELNAAVGTGFALIGTNSGATQFTATGTTALTAGSFNASTTVVNNLPVINSSAATTTNATSTTLALYNNDTSPMWSLRNLGSYLSFATTSNVNAANSGATTSVDAIRIQSSGVGFGSGTTTLNNSYAVFVNPASSGFGNIFTVANATATPLYVTANGAVYAPNTTIQAGAATDYWCYDAAGQLIRVSAICTTSALRFKKDIQTLNIGLNDLLKLRPVSYYRKEPLDEMDSHKQIGFIADEVASTSPALNEALVTYVGGGTSGTVQGFRYDQFTALITKSIQDFYGQFQKLVARVSGLEKKVNAQQKEIDDLNARLLKLEK